MVESVRRRRRPSPLSGAKWAVTGISGTAQVPRYSATDRRAGRAQCKAWVLCATGPNNALEDVADRPHSSNIILGVYLIIFGVGKDCYKLSDNTHQLT